MPNNIFRLQSDNNVHGLSNTINHWDNSQMYGDIQINAIESTNINSMHQPTSIPSPFARIALVKTAFAAVARYGENALAAYKKIVSDTLDVAEIFFTFDKWKDKVEIIQWKYGRQDNNQELADNSDLRIMQVGHNQLYKTLKTFLENDADAYNFDKMDSIYILKHRATGKMIGATSPCTLFFSSANNYDGIDLKFNSTRKAFNGIFPLHQRTWEFQKYLYSWYAVRRMDQDLNISVFDEFINYLDAQKPLINRTAEIDALNEIDTNLYDELRAPNVEVLNKPIYKLKTIPPVYWSADDILENVIIRLPYKINKESFFDGNLPNNNDRTYLLPIKDKFFEYYSIENLRDAITINYVGDVAEVKINIPGQANPIEKRYSGDTLITRTFDCAIFPYVKFSNDNENLANYRFGLVCNFDERDRFNAKFVKINSVIDQAQKRFSVRNETHNLNRQLKNYTLESSNFDYIRIECNNNFKGIIIPNFINGGGNNQFTFAVDFGTTNTHIEYKIDNNIEIRTFDITNQIDRQIHYLHGGERFLKNYFDEEYITPYTGDEFKFPMRTALSYGENTIWNNVYPFEKACLNELYEKRLDFPYNRTETDLKWATDQNYMNKVKLYIDSIMYILRNKVILNHGNLLETKIIWFYPVSMERNRYENLVTAWNDSYNKYFGDATNNIISITESIAPFEYFIRDGNASNLVTIDIGGGTTDVVISSGGTANYITSFRFAANAVFGDGYAENNRVKNGIVRQFFNPIKNELQNAINDENDDIFNIFNDMYASRRSDDIASFLFSLKYNRRVLAIGQNLADNVNLNKKLINDTTQKITFIFFYTAIIYHIAKLMKTLNSDMPDKIVFSGNGSLLIQFLTNDNIILSEYSKLIFKKVYNSEYPAYNLSIILNCENPKEATCKGGFNLTQQYDYDNIHNKKVVLHSNGTNQVIIKREIPQESDKYISINENYIEKTVEEVNHFIDFVFDNLSFFTNRGYQLNNESINIASDICRQRLSIYASSGWNKRRNDVVNDELINESLFFYPLVGMLKELTDAICDYNINQN